MSTPFPLRERHVEDHRVLSYEAIGLQEPYSSSGVLPLFSDVGFLVTYVNFIADHDASGHRLPTCSTQASFLDFPGEVSSSYRPQMRSVTISLSVSPFDTCPSGQLVHVYGSILA